MKKIAPIWFCPCLCLVSSAYADTGASLEQLLSLGLEELLTTTVSISTNTKQTLSKAPSVVSVITAEDIKATGATNLAEILQTIPGVYVRTNLFGYRPTITFRGAAYTHTLLMVDGAPRRDLVWSTGIFWKGLSTNMIERVEIIRGPGSALFGSDASAGVINVITKAASRTTKSELGGRLGSFDTQTAWLQHGGHWNGFDIDLTAELSHTDDYSPSISTDGQTAKDRNFGTQVSHAPGRANYGYDNQDFHISVAKGNWQMLADHQRKADVGIGLTGAGVLDPATRGGDSRSDLALLYNSGAPVQDWSLGAELRYYQLDYTSGEGFQERPAGYRDATGNYPDGFINRMRSAQRGYSLESSGLYRGLSAHAIRVGGGYKSDNLYLVEQSLNLGQGPSGAPLPAGGPMIDVSDSAYAFAPEKIRQIRYLFLQDVWTISNQWELTAGARYDHYSDFGDTLNPRLALVWQSTDRLTSKLMYGRAFRAPSYLELYSLTAANKPNANLTPERSQTWDLSFLYSVSKDLKLGVDFYQFAQSNLIAADAANQFQNVGNNTARGIEIEAQWQVTSALRLTGNLSSRNETLAFNPVPKQKAYLRSDWAFLPNWHWNVQANRIGKHALLSGDPRAPIPAYTVVDSTVRYSYRRDWEFAAAIRNLFDVDARETTSSSLIDNLPLPRRSVFTEIRYKF
jgi:outer membrane receptor protein involved in Fe transport